MLFDWLSNNRRIYQTLCEDIVTMQKKQPEELIRVNLEANDIVIPKRFWRYGDTAVGLKSEVYARDYQEAIRREFPLHTAPWMRERAMKESVARLTTISQALVREFNATTLAQIVRVQTKDLAHYVVSEQFPLFSDLPKKRIELTEANRYLAMLSIS